MPYPTSQLAAMNAANVSATCTSLQRSKACERLRFRLCGLGFMVRDRGFGIRVALFNASGGGVVVFIAELFGGCVVVLTLFGNDHWHAVGRDEQRPTQYLDSFAETKVVAFFEGRLFVFEISHFLIEVESISIHGFDDGECLVAAQLLDGGGYFVLVGSIHNSVAVLLHEFGRLIR
jgi:hypothetical protein